MENTNNPENYDKTVISKKGVKVEASKSKTNLLGKCFNDRYLIESQIGTGGMSDVYRAVDLHLKNAGVDESFVAIKILQTQFSDMPDAQQILINEALQTQKLSHPNIIRVYDVNSDGDYYFMVMEWLDGESLDQIINSSKPIGTAFEKTKVIIDQIADALAYAHSEALIHTDLKPSNIFLTRKGKIKIFDFGVARYLTLNDESYQYSVQEETNNSALNGHTPAYASLEQLNGEAPSKQDDIYAFSCIIYELLTSKHPYNRVAANKIKPLNSKLIKPKNLSISHWSSLKKGLALKKIDRVKNVSDLSDSFDKKLSSKIAIGLLVLVVGGIGANALYKQSQEINTLTNQLAITTQQTETINSYAALSASDFLKQAEQIQSKNHLIAQALFREHQSELIGIFDNKIDNIPTLKDGKYKDYTSVNAVLDQAFKYYPDSERLQKIKKHQDTSRESTITALVEKLDQLLIQGRYSEPGESSISNLLSDLSLLLLPDEKYVATDKAFKLFEKNFNKSIANQNYNALNNLIEVGELVFYNYPGAEDIIESSKLMTTAVSALAKYSEDVKKSPKTAVFPQKEAAIFYKNEIESLTKQLSDARNYSGYMRVDNRISTFAKKFPKGFDPLVKLQEQEASSLFTYANKLMEIRSFVRAKRLINRGNALLRELK